MMQMIAATPDNSALQIFYGTIPLVGAILLANWNNNSRLKELSNRMDDLKVSLNKRIEDLQSSLNRRIDDLSTTTTNGFKDTKDQLGRLEGRVTDLEKASRFIRS